MITKNIFRFIILAIVVGVAASCGGGGGGGGTSVNHAGDVYLEVERSDLDSGDLDRVNVEIANLNPKGAILKFRIPRSLSYEKKSGMLFPGRDEETRITPDYSVSNENERYIVFFFSPRDAIDGDYISLQFTLRAVSGDKKAFIEYDLDNNDPSISDSREFSAQKPRFTAQERRSIYIAPDSESPTPTPVAAGTTTPSATGTPKA
jgi:hypothetical protein